MTEPCPLSYCDGTAKPAGDDRLECSRCGLVLAPQEWDDLCRPTPGAVKEGFGMSEEKQCEKCLEFYKRLESIDRVRREERKHMEELEEDNRQKRICIAGLVSEVNKLRRNFELLNAAGVYMTGLEKKHD